MAALELDCVLLGSGLLLTGLAIRLGILCFEVAEVDIVDLRGHTVRPLVVLERQRDHPIVFSTE